jgi:hypothetical protein
MADNRGTHPSQRRYPPELRERAVRMVLETIPSWSARFRMLHGSVSLRSFVWGSVNECANLAGDPSRLVLLNEVPRPLQ